MVAAIAVYLIVGAILAGGAYAVLRRWAERIEARPEPSSDRIKKLRCSQWLAAPVLCLAALAWAGVGVRFPQGGLPERLAVLRGEEGQPRETKEHSG